MGTSTDSRRGLGYFASIDGLRSIAVISVFIFHLQNELLAGGYVGVDIFFVISGFVVTASLVHTSFDRFRDLLAFFYARRLVRILPPLLVCLVVTTTLYTALIPSSWLSNFTEKTGVAAFLGFSNVLLSLNNDNYFAPVADYNPFLHTWSLGVEEQFYFVFPFLLFLYFKSRNRQAHRRAVLSIIAVLGLVSFGLCGALTTIKWDYGFYLLPSRFWQLATGMALALTFQTWQPRLARLPASLANAMAVVWAGMLCIAFAIPSGPYFPFPMALLPTIAAALAIMLCAARPGDLASRVLASPLPLAVGLRSYSLYLWHWPIIVLMRWTTSVDTVALMIAATVLSFVMAELSYRFVERPFRQSPRIKAARRSKVAFAGAAAALVGAVAGYAITHARPVISISRTADVEDWQAGPDSRLLPGPPNCALSRTTRDLAGGQVDEWARTNCSSYPGTVYTIGNSHAQGYAPAIRQLALDTGHDSVLYFKSGCGYALLYLPLLQSENCGEFIEKATRDLEARLKPGDIVFLASFRLRQPIDQWGKVIPLKKDPAAERAGMEEARVLLARLTRTGARVVFEAPKPLLNAPVYRCVDWYTRLNPICSVGLAVGRDEILALRHPIMKMMETLAQENDHVTIWDPLPTLCPGKTCSAFESGKPLFFDMHHLSNYGNRVLRTSLEGYMMGLCCANARGIPFVNSGG